MKYLLYIYILKAPEPEIQNILHREMETRLTQLQQRVTSLRAESEEVWKTLETAESTLLEMLSAKDYDCSGYFGDNAVPASKPPETVSIKLRADRQETEEFYLSVSKDPGVHKKTYCTGQHITWNFKLQILN